METKNKQNDIKNENNVKKNEDVANEQKSDISDEKKSTLASRGFGAIIFIGVALGLIYFLISSGNKKVEVKPKDEKFEVSIEQKTFTPSPAVVETLVEQNISQNTAASTTKSIEAQKPEPSVIKSLRGAMVSTQGQAQANSRQSTASGSASNPYQSATSASEANPYQSAIDSNNEYIKKLQSGAGDFQKQMASLMGGGNAEKEEGEEESAQAAIRDGSAVVTARKSTINPNLSLDKGTFIPCVLKTQIVSMVAGNVACVITDDVYSSSGTVLLIEKGSMVQGVFKKGEMQLGMDRLYVIWEEIKTPKRVIINIGSGATDELGGSGMQGWVDNHWIERFGAAIMLSMIDDALSFALGRAKNNIDAESAYYYTQGTRDAAVNMADIVLQKTINIPPTLYKNHGDIVGIYVNKDVDFSQVYKLIRDKK
jgi:type IV secretion system protein VirB10